MIDLLFRIGLSNACVSLALAVMAITVQATVKRPHLTYPLWLLVFLKLLTPPLVTIPIPAIPAQINEAFVAPLNGSADGDFLPAQTWLAAWDRAKIGLSLAWLVGSGIVFAWSLGRAYRFNRLLGMESEPAPDDLQSAARKIAAGLGLKAIPAISITAANLSPMVWWIGGKARIVIPSALLGQMGARRLQWVLAHELAHVRRRDYLVRWLEWLACVGFWWNPVVWWARRNLRATEELCCDALVVSSLGPKPGTYADSLLTAIECLARPVCPPPALASEINSGGQLERRFKMIVSGTLNGPASRWFQASVLLWALAALPLGLGCARESAAQTSQERDEAKSRAYPESMGERAGAGERRPSSLEGFAVRMNAGVETGKITQEQADEYIEGYRQRMAVAEAGRAALVKKYDLDGDGEISGEERAASRNR